jgi:hypothetical protein
MVANSIEVRLEAIVSSSLILPLKKVVPFDDVLQRARKMLSTFLKLDSVPPLQVELPPRFKNSKHIPTLMDRLVDVSFPGAYVCFERDEQSVVDCHVFEGGSNSTNLMLGFGTV